MQYSPRSSSISSTRLPAKLRALKGLSFAGAIAVTGIASAAVYPTSNLLTNPGFETNVLTSIGNVVGPPYLTNIWGDEASTITTAVGAVSPSSGTQMLSMTTDFLTATQTLQSDDVSAFSSDISAGLLIANFSAKFNVASNIPAAKAGVILQFYDSAHNLVGSTSTATLTLDTNPATWEQISLANIAVPTTTKYVGSQVLYNDASLAVNGQNNPGYVDDAVLTLDKASTPEPGSLMVLIPAGAMLLLRRRRQIV